MSDQIEAAGALVTAGLAANALDQPSASGHGGTCANCGTALSGAFCSHCGQRAHLHRSVGDVFHEFLHGITHFDGKAWTTLPMLLFRPGRLTRSYIEGQRARYIAPVPLFLLVVFTMFFVLSFVSIKENTLPVTINAGEIARGQAEMAQGLAEIDKELAAARARGDSDAVKALEASRKLATAMGNGAANLAGDSKAAGSFTDRLADTITENVKRGNVKVNFGAAYFDDKANKALKNPKLVFYKLQSKAYKLSFLLVPLSLPWLWLVFVWRRGVGMYDHAIFTLYSISFISLWFIVASGLLAADIVSEYIWVPMVLAPAAHLFVQLRGAYQLGWWGAAWRTTYLTIAAGITLSLYMVILVVLGVID